MPRTIVPITELRPSKATHTTAISGTHNDLVFTANKRGPVGNSIRVRYVQSGNNTPLTVVVEGFDITVNLATDGGGAVTSTAALVLAALQASTDAMVLVSVALAASNDGTGVVDDFAFTALAGGGHSTTPPSLVNGDTTNGHYIAANDGLTIVEVTNTNAGAQNVTLRAGPNAHSLGALPSEVTSVPGSNGVRILGPFEPGTFDQNLARDVYFDAGHADLRFRAYRIVRA